MRTPRGVLGSEILLHTHTHTLCLSLHPEDSLPVSEYLYVGLWQSRMEEGGSEAWPLPGGTAVGIARESQGTQMTGREAQMRASKALLGSGSCWA